MFLAALSLLISFTKCELYFPFPQPEISREPHESDPTLQVVKFATSPLMSTYLVAVVVGEYDYVEDTSADGIKVSLV